MIYCVSRMLWWQLPAQCPLCDYWKHCCTRASHSYAIVTLLSAVSMLGNWLACFTPGCWCDSRVESSFSSALCSSRSCVIDWLPPCLPVPNWVMLAQLQRLLCGLPSAALFLRVMSAGLGQFIACRGVASTMFLWYLVAKKKKAEVTAGLAQIVQ